MSVDQDLATLHTALLEVETAARSLPWAKQRPWRVRTHLGAANGLPMVDLHDLSVRVALDAVERCLTCELSCGGVIFITGRGRHTGGRSKLRDSVLAHLHALPEPEVRTLGPGRIEVVLDPDRVRAARPGLGLIFWLMVALVVLGVLAAVANRL